MKVRYKSGSLYIVEIIDEKVYYGNGENLNSFGCHAVQFLPDMLHIAIWRQYLPG